MSAKIVQLPAWRQLRWRLLALFLLLTSVPLGLVQALTLPQLEANARQQALNQLESVADLKQHQIERWLTANKQLVALLATGPSADTLVPFASEPTPDAADQERVDAILRSAIASADAAGGTQRPLRSLFMYTPNGTVIAASDPVQLGRVVSGQPYFRSSLADAYLQSPYYAVGSAELTSVLTHPLRRDGALVGVLAATLDLATLGEVMLERSGLGGSGETYLVSLESNYLLTPSRFEGYPLTRAYRSEGINQALQQADGEGAYQNYRDPPVNVLGVYRWLPELQAALIAEVEVAEALAGNAQARQLSLVLTLAAIGAAALAAFFIAKQVAQPIARLTGVAARITAGDLGARAPVDSDHEVGVLAVAFNEMAGELEQTQAGLEQRVAERTAELAQANAEAEQALADLQHALTARDQLSAAIRDISSPVVSVLPGIVIMPLIGAIDTERASIITSTLLTALERQRTEVAILDVTGVPLVDTQVAQVLINTAAAARLLGVETVLVGLRPELAQTIVGLGVELRGLQTRADLADGVQYALKQRERRQGRQELLASR
jgi:anti-anti-sigma regulatory factor/HAMP domain-containing protein